MEASLDERNLRCLLALLRAPGLGARALGSLFASGLSPAAIYELPAPQLLHMGLGAATVAYMQDTPWSVVDDDLRWLEKDDHYLVTPSSDYYPRLLKEIHDPPPALFIKGNPQALATIQLGIVGSRNPTPDGRRTARNFARELSALGLTITSGLALGIDSCSHLGAMDAGGRTLAILGNGLRMIYPRSNRKLADSVLEHGALVSELPLDCSPLPANFPRRNRIISGCSIAILVVEAAFRSGSLITAHCAMEQGRDVFAIPGSIHNPLTRGCHALIREGAKLVEQVQDITEEIGPLAAVVNPGNSHAEVSRPHTMGLDADAKLLLDSIGFQPVNVDYLVEAAGLTVDVVSRTLLKLEIDGLIETWPGGLYVRKSL